MRDGPESILAYSPIFTAWQFFPLLLWKWHQQPWMGISRILTVQATAASCKTQATNTAAGLTPALPFQRKTSLQRQLILPGFVLLVLEDGLRPSLADA